MSAIQGYLEIINEIVQRVKDSGEPFKLYLNPEDLRVVLNALYTYSSEDSSLLSDIISQFDWDHVPVVQ